MAIDTATKLGACDGFEVVTPAGFVGWVEETWLDGRDDPTAFALRLHDGRRGLLLAGSVVDQVPERRTLLVGTDVRVLELEPPHVDANGELAASWRTTGAPIELPDPPGQLHHALLALHRPVVPATGARPTERPVWQLILVLYALLGAIAVALIGLDFLVAYASAGRAY